MKTVFADKHAGHFPGMEIDGGKVLECAEKPERAENVLRAVRAAGLGPVIAPRDCGMAPLLRVHNADYVAFLQTAHAEWAAAGHDGPAFATNFNLQHACKTPPRAITGKMGYYLADTSLSITAGTWTAQVWNDGPGRAAYTLTFQGQ